MITQSDTELYSVPARGHFSFRDVNIDDPRVFAMLSRGDTIGIFQLESQLGQIWSKKIKPQSLEDIATVIAIIRPGVLDTGMADEYVKRKNGESPVEYLHPSLEPILKDTYGVLLYQEQSIRIARDIAGFTESEADLLRKGIGHKLPEIIYKCKKDFVEKATIKGIVTKDEAESIFSWIQKGQKYLFNASHSLEYSKDAYWSAYCKCHFPTEFYCAWLTFSDEKTDPKEEIYKLVQDARLHNIIVKTPDIRRKNVDFEIIKDREIIFGLSHIRNVGNSAIKAINNNKEDLNTFIGFLKSIKSIRRNVAESLVKSGACDFYNISRTDMLRQIHIVYGRSDKEIIEETPENKHLTPNEYECFIENINLGMQAALQKIIDDKACVKKRIPTIEAKIKHSSVTTKDTNKQKSIWERLYLGLNLTCSAADDVNKSEDSISCKEAYYKPSKSKVTLHAVIDAIKLKKTGEKSKNPGLDYCYLDVSDQSGAISGLICWPEMFEKIKSDLREDVVVCINAYKDNWKGKDQFVVNNLTVIG